MKISFHGGACCGIKHINNLGCSPLLPGYFEGECSYYSDDEEEDGYYDPTADGDSFSSDDHWGPKPPTGLTSGDLLKHYVNFIKKHQPGCVVEVVLSLSGGWDQSAWIPVLTELGFYPVGQPFTNSNSGAKLQIFHLLIQGGEVVPYQKKEGGK